MKFLYLLSCVLSVFYLTQLLLQLFQKPSFSFSHLQCSKRSGQCYLEDFQINFLFPTVLSSKEGRPQKLNFRPTAFSIISQSLFVEILCLLSFSAPLDIFYQLVLSIVKSLRSQDLSVRVLLDFFSFMDFRLNELLAASSRKLSLSLD